MNTSINGPVAPGPGGGFGGKPSLKETRLAARALAERWPISKEHRTLVVETLTNALRDRDLKVREKTAAARALISASKCSQDAIRTAVFATKNGPDETLERAREVSETLKEFLRETRELAQAEDAQTDPEQARA
jgi:hypothetical protein